MSVYKKLKTYFYSPVFPAVAFPTAEVFGITNWGVPTAVFLAVVTSFGYLYIEHKTELSNSLNGGQE